MIAPPRTHEHADPRTALVRASRDFPVPSAARRPSGWLAVASVEVVRLYPLLGDDGRAERQLAAEHGCGDDLGELVDPAGAIAAQQLQAFALRRQGGAAAVGGNDERRDRH